jgi:hypothetical protein
MSTPAHRRKTTQPDYFPPVPDGAIPAQRRPDAGVHRAEGATPGRGRMAAGVALVLAAAVGAGWLLLSPSSNDTDHAAAASGLAQVLPAPGSDTPRLTGRIPAGTFDVDHEAEAGVYRTGGATVLDGSAGCRWQTSGGGVGPLVAGGTTSGPATVTLRAGTDFTSIGCQDWVRVG